MCAVRVIRRWLGPHRSLTVSDSLLVTEEGSDFGAVRAPLTSGLSHLTRARDSHSNSDDTEERDRLSGGDK